MRFQVSTIGERVKAMKQWQKWFAWYPVRFTDTREMVWLETVQRRAIFHYEINWEYRPRRAG